MRRSLITLLLIIACCSAANAGVVGRGRGIISFGGITPDAYWTPSWIGYLVGYWSMDSTNAAGWRTDGSVYTNHAAPFPSVGALNGFTLIGTNSLGREEYCQTIDDGEYVSPLDQDQHTFTLTNNVADSKFSMCAWVWDSDVTVARMVMCKNANGALQEWQLNVTTIYGTNGRVALIIRNSGDGSPNYIVSSAEQVITNNTWHHIAATYDPVSGTTNDIQLYVDGTKVGKRDDLSGGSYVAMQNTSQRPTFGRFGAAGQNFIGFLDEIFIASNYTWNASEVTEVMTKSSRENNLVKRPF